MPHHHFIFQKKIRIMESRIVIFSQHAMTKLHVVKKKKKKFWIKKKSFDVISHDVHVHILYLYIKVWTQNLMEAHYDLNHQTTSRHY
jgi:hypothetical protein